MAIAQHRPLQELFELEQAPPSQPAAAISLGTLALSLGCSLDRLLPLAEHGFLRLRSARPLSSASLVEVVSEPALVWLRGWLQPAQAKLLLAAADLADILEVPLAAVSKLAAEHNIPVVWEPALGGLVFSLRAARTLLLAVLRSRAEQPLAARWDRQAWLWMLLGEDPEALVSPPPLTYSEALEREIDRVAALDEPARSLRAAGLLQQFEDARRVAESGKARTTETAAGLATSPVPGEPVSALDSSPWKHRLARLRRVVER